MTAAANTMKTLWNAAAKTTLRRLVVPLQHQQAAAVAMAVGSKRAHSSSLQEAPVSPPDCDASHYGYRVVVNRRASSTMTSRMSDPHHHNHNHHNIQDDYEEFFQTHDVSSTNLDILSSPEVQEILHSQHDGGWDSGSHLPESTMKVTGLRDTILDNGGYDSDCEEMAPEDLEHSNAAAHVMEETASFAVVTEDTSDAVMDSDDK